MTTTQRINSDVKDRGLAGRGRIRIGGGSPQAQVGGGPSRAPSGIATDAVLDVEGYNRLLEPCPSR